MKQTSPITQNFPLKIVGSTKFGRYPKISIEQTFNMLISDGWLVNFSGYRKVINISNDAQGRSNYTSTRFNHIIFVINNDVYITNDSLSATRVATLDSFSGDVFIAENNAGQIAICDLRDIYIYDQTTGNSQKATIDFVPGYISFHNTRFLSIDRNNAEWRLSAANNGLSWPNDSSHAGAFQTKSDKLEAVFPMPGKGNVILVMGQQIGEIWTDVGAQLFPYQKNSTSNLPYGTANAATIAFNDNYVAWLASNSQSGYAIMVSNGGMPVQISNDGINFKLASLLNPQNSYGFFFKQDGHLIYVLTFPSDNFSICFDFETKMFFTLTDENMDYFIARNVVFFNNSYYFVSFRDGHLYQLDTQFTTYDGAEIPRIRIVPTFRMPDDDPYIVDQLMFTIEQGYSSENSSVHYSMSKDGNQSFSSFFSMQLNPLGDRTNRFRIWNLGYANEFTSQFRFWGMDRFVAKDGEIRIYQ